jgi:hypothetical protein
VRCCPESGVDQVAEWATPPSVGLHPDRNVREGPVKAALDASRPRNRSAPTTPPQPRQVRRPCEGLSQPEGVAAGGVTSQPPFRKPARRLTQDVRPRLSTETKISCHPSGYVAERAGPDSALLQPHLPPRDLPSEDDVAVGLRARRDVCGEEESPLRVHSGNGGIDALRCNADRRREFGTLHGRRGTARDISHRIGFWLCPRRERLLL